jgi:hypothetical protein
MLAAIAIAVATVDVAAVTLTVRAAPTIPDRVVAEALGEAAAIWQPTGVALVWRIADTDESDAAPDSDSGSMPAGVELRVHFDDGSSTERNFTAPLGSIVFDAHGAQRDVHLSYANALWLLRDLYGDGCVNRMTIVERRTRLSRALGRALAHEVGHYLFASKEHTSDGLMKARQLAGELFGPSRHAFEITDAQRSDALSHLQRTERLARH